MRTSIQPKHPSLPELLSAEEEKHASALTGAHTGAAQHLTRFESSSSSLETSAFLLGFPTTYGPLPSPLY